MWASCRHEICTKAPGVQSVPDRLSVDGRRKGRPLRNNPSDVLAPGSRKRLVKAGIIQMEVKNKQYKRQRIAGVFFWCTRHGSPKEITHPKMGDWLINSKPKLYQKSKAGPKKRARQINRILPNPVDSHSVHLPLRISANRLMRPAVSVLDNAVCNAASSRPW